MASSWIDKRTTATGVRYRVMFRVAGRGSPRYAGSFRTEREAKLRQRWVADELAAMRVPDVRVLTPQASLRVMAERWRASRIDVAERTAVNHRVDLERVLPMLGDTPIDAIKSADIASCIAALNLKKETLRKTLTTLSQVFAFAGVEPNPARDRTAIRLPREDRPEVCPPTAAHVAAVHRLLPAAYRLATIVLDQTGMRVGELERLTWGDCDEHAGRWRVSATVAKTRRARWVPVPELVFAAVVELVPRDDRDLDGQVFAGFAAERFRTALSRACKAAGVPVFSPHDLRHRRATLWHLTGVPAADAAAWLGHSPTEHLRTYAHASLVDRSEIDVPETLGRSRTSHTSVIPDAVKVLD